MRAIASNHYLLEVRLKRSQVPSFDAYPFCLPAVKCLRTLKLHPAVTFIIATHSPILMAYPNARILQLTDRGLRPVRYVDTEYYTLTKAFLSRHERMLAELMKEEGPA